MKIYDFFFRNRKFRNSGISGNFYQVFNLIFPSKLSNIGTYYIKKGVRNFVKLIIMSLLSVHSELFLLNKSLIQVVFTYAVKEIYSKLLTLFSNIPQFGQQPAIQTYIDVFCLREVFKVYTVDESKEIIAKILKLIPTNSIYSDGNRE